MEDWYDIIDRQKEYEDIQNLIRRMEIGLRAIAITYDNHSDDKNSFEKIFQLKDNIYYRLCSAEHLFLIFLRELKYQENYLTKIVEEDPNKLSGFVLGNPFFIKTETELASVFDAIIYHLNSSFDYLSHIICYACISNKTKTVYWSRLITSATGKGNEIAGLKIKDSIKQTDQDFVGRLNDYRSRLIHTKRDVHPFAAKQKNNPLRIELQMEASECSQKHFKKCLSKFSDKKISLAFLTSLLIKETLRNIEILLDSLRVEILSNSSLDKNINNSKGSKSLIIISYNSINKESEYLCDSMWKQFKTNSIINNQI